MVGITYHGSFYNKIQYSTAIRKMLQIKVAVVLILCCGLMTEVTAYRRHHRPRKSSSSSSSSEKSKHGDGNGLGGRVAVLEGLVAALQNEQASTNSILGQLNASLQQCKDDYANLADVLEAKCDDLQEQLDAVKAKLEEICEALGKHLCQSVLPW